MRLRRAAGWKGAYVVSVLALWLAVGIAWGPRAVLVFGFFVFVAAVFAVWSILAGRLGQAAGGWYYERQLGTGPRDRRRHARR